MQNVHAVIVQTWLRAESPSQTRLVRAGPRPAAWPARGAHHIRGGHAGGGGGGAGGAPPCGRAPGGRLLRAPRAGLPVRLHAVAAAVAQAAWRPLRRSCARSDMQAFKLPSSRLLPSSSVLRLRPGLSSTTMMLFSWHELGRLQSVERMCCQQTCLEGPHESLSSGNAKPRLM